MNCVDKFLNVPRYADNGDDDDDRVIISSVGGGGGGVGGKVVAGCAKNWHQVIKGFTGGRKPTDSSQLSTIGPAPLNAFGIT